MGGLVEKVLSSKEVYVGEKKEGYRQQEKQQ